MYVNLGLVRLFCFHHIPKKKKEKLPWCQKRRWLTDGSQHRPGLLCVASKHNPSLKCLFCFTEKGKLSFSFCSSLSGLSATSGARSRFSRGTRPVLIVLPISLIGSKQSSGGRENALLLAIAFNFAQVISETVVEVKVGREDLKFQVNVLKLHL